MDRFGPAVAVDGFLLISGFSIAASYAKQPRDFYFRRALRIYPLYLFAVIGSAGIFMFIPDQMNFFQAPRYMPSYSQTVLNLCFCQGFISRQLASNGVIWTISLEVFFYAITPWLARQSTRSMGLLCACSLFAFVSMRYRITTGGNAMWGANVLMLGWAWLAGYWLYRVGPDRAGIVVMAGGLVALSLSRIGAGSWYALTWAFSVAAIVYGHRLRLNKWVSATFAYLGEISYPLYLVHVPVYILFFGLGLPSSEFLFVGSALVLSAVVDALYDKPVKRLIVRVVNRLGSGRAVHLSSSVASTAVQVA